MRMDIRVSRKQEKDDNVNGSNFIKPDFFVHHRYTLLSIPDYPLRIPERIGGKMLCMRPSSLCRCCQMSKRKTKTKGIYNFDVPYPSPPAAPYTATHSSSLFPELSNQAKNTSPPKTDSCL